MSASSDSDEKRAWRLRRLVDHAYRKVPYYRALLDGAGVDPGSIRGPADLARLPLTGKEDLAPLPLSRRLAAGTNVARLRAIGTSGSTGIPFIIHRTWKEQGRWERRWFQDLRRAGLRPRHRAASVFLIRSGPEPRYRGRRLLSALGVYRTLRLHCGLEPEALLDDMERFQANFIGGLPGTLAQVAGVIQRRGGTSLRPAVLWLIGEVVDEAMRLQLGRAFGARIHDAYGCHELGLLASQCPQSTLLHVHEDDSIVEVVDDHGRPVAPGESGELVATALGAFAAPFIRYRPGDQVKRGPSRCPCGAPVWTLEKIQGRTVHHFRLPGGRLIHPWDVTVSVLEAMPWLRRYQLIQETETEVTLTVIRDDGEQAAAVCETVAARMRHLLGPEVNLRLRRVAEIPAGPGGKSQTLVSHVTAPSAT